MDHQSTMVLIVNSAAAKSQRRVTPRRLFQVSYIVLFGNFASECLLMLLLAASQSNAKTSEVE